MKFIRFSWDETKNQANILKHGVSFEDAQRVFLDDYAIEFDDFGHSDEEERFLLLGMDDKNRILMICHCYRESRDVVRLISARRTTKSERKHYLEGEV